MFTSLKVLPRAVSRGLVLSSCIEHNSHCTFILQQGAGCVLSRHRSFLVCGYLSLQPCEDFFCVAQLGGMVKHEFIGFDVKSAH